MRRCLWLVVTRPGRCSPNCCPYFNDPVTLCCAQDYLNFLLSHKQGSEGYSALFASGVLGSDEAKRTADIRRVFQRALSVPTHSLESIWKMYDSFENSVGAKQVRGRRLAERWSCCYSAGGKLGGCEFA